MSIPMIIAVAAIVIYLFSGEGRDLGDILSTLWLIVIIGCVLFALFIIYGLRFFPLL